MSEIKGRINNTALHAHVVNGLSNVVFKGK